MGKTPTKKELAYRNRTPKISKECSSCSKVFIRPPSLSGKFCSHSCYWESMRGKEKKNQKKVNLKCKFCKSEFMVWECRLKDGKKYCSKQCQTKDFKGNIPWNKGKKSNISGEKHYNWQGGKTKKSLQIIHSFEYRMFRKSIFKRDNYTCVLCSDNRGGNLQVDHIKPRSLFPDLIFDEENCRTLCISCHKDTPTYLNPNMKKEDFNYVN
jgi:5-methylcytosine-specific restriction endonuclease McrA